MTGFHEAALKVSCGHCWASPGSVCVTGGLHVARYARAYRRGLISAAALAAILEAVVVFTPDTVVSTETARSAA